MIYFFWITDLRASFSPEEQAHQAHILSFCLHQEEAEPATITIQFPLGTVLGQYALVTLRSKDGIHTPCFRGYVDQVHQAEGRIKVHLKAVQYKASWERIAKRIQSQQKAWNVFWEEDDTSWKHVLSSTTDVPYWCPVSGECTVSPLVGTLQEAVIVRDSLETYVVQSAQVPAIGTIQLEVRAQWIQYVQGVLDLFPWISKQFSNHTIATCTPESLKKVWPKSGSLLGNSGYRILHSELELDSYHSTFVEVKNSSGDPHIVQRSVYDGSLWVFWNFKQKRKEVIHTVWDSVIPGDPLTLRWNLGKVTNAQTIDSWSPTKVYKKGDTVRFGQQIFEATQDHYHVVFQTPQNWRVHLEHTQALSSTTQSSFFLTDLGKHAFHYALERAYRLWLQGARCRKVLLKGSVEHLASLTLKHTVQIHHPQWGAFYGKVTAHTLNIEPEGAWVALEIQGLHPDATQAQPNPQFEDRTGEMYAQGYAPGWYVDPDRVEGKGPLCYRAYDALKPEDAFVHAPFLGGNQLIESIDVKFDDQAQIQHLSQKTAHQKARLPSTSIKVHFRPLKGRASLAHRIQVHMQSRIFFTLS